MYNRYIPQPDGSYRKNPIVEQPREPVQTPSVPAPPPPQTPPPPNPNCQSCPHRQPHRQPPPAKPQSPSRGNGFFGYLKQLLPKNFEAEDLLVVLLLLLMAGDCREDQNSALLTLVLYLFL